MLLYILNRPIFTWAFRDQPRHQRLSNIQIICSKSSGACESLTHRYAANDLGSGQHECVLINMDEARPRGELTYPLTPLRNQAREELAFLRPCSKRAEEACTEPSIHFSLLQPISWRPGRPVSRRRCVPAGSPSTPWLKHDSFQRSTDEEQQGAEWDGAHLCPSNTLTHPKKKHTHSDKSDC